MYLPLMEPMSAQKAEMLLPRKDSQAPVASAGGV